MGGVGSRSRRGGVGRTGGVLRTQRLWYSRFLIMRAGRGLPKLVDEHIVMLVMVDELGRVRRGAGGAGAAELAAVMEKAMSSIESFKSRPSPSSSQRCLTSSRRSTT